ncbi:MAG TPA: cytochrome c-type biogenesis protein [Cellvibrio sp.]|nr:cytochrome c-type biogenesis protein [Cellvibrio sp.]
MRSFLAVMAALLMLCALSLHSQAAIETHSFANDVERLRYQSFIEEMRCPKCQNQNLAGSDSPISMDLRRELYQMIKDGRSDGEIVNFMVTRYGDFILYRPRVTPATYFLWGAPVVLLILGVVIVLLIVRKRRRNALERSATHLTGDEQARLAALLSRAESSSESIAPNKNQQELK